MTARRLALPFVLALASGCIREPVRPLPPPTPVAVLPTPGIYYEENLQPAPAVRLEIIDLSDAQDPASKRITVTGTLINRGDRPTTQVSVRVSALDEHGDTVISVAAVPSTDRIGANGGTARFTAEFSGNAAIRSYDVEAVAR